MTIPPIISALLRRRISVPQYAALYHIGATSLPFAMSALSSVMGHTSAATTGLVDRMESEGYVSRGAQKGDRRVVLLTLTKAGRALLAEIEQEASR